MADFGDYAGQYLTMAREGPQNINLLSRLAMAQREEPYRRQVLQAQAAEAQSQIPYMEQMAQARLQGTPFEQRKQTVTERMAQQAADRQQLNTQRLLAGSEEDRRRNAESERIRTKTQADADTIARYRAALKAYEMGIGPNPGPAPGTQMAAAGGAPTSPAAQPPMPEDLMRLPPGARNKIMAERIAERPQAITKIEGLTTTLDQMIDEAKQLQEHPSIVSGSGWTGTVLRNTPDFTEKGARNFGERMKSLGAQIGFNALSQMREMSKTGGALGQVSDFENRRLEGAISALDAMQSPDDIKRGLRQVMNYAGAAKKNMANAYQRTYGEKLPQLEKKEVVPGGNAVAASELTATGPNGQRLVFRDGQWQPIP